MTALSLLVWVLLILLALASLQPRQHIPEMRPPTRLERLEAYHHPRSYGVNRTFGLVLALLLLIILAERFS